MTKRLALLLPALATTTIALAREASDTPPKPSSIGDPMVTMLVIIMAILLLIIILLANVLIGTATYFYEKEKEIEAEKKKMSLAPTALTIIAILLSFPIFAQDVPANAEAVMVQAKSFGALSSTAFSFVTGVIVTELLVIVVLLWQLRSFLFRVKKQNGKEKEKKTIAWKAIWIKLNSFKSKEEEKALEMDHEYDGIRELDNRLPPWWIYGFYATIIFAVIYLWRYHVSESAPLSQQEYNIAMEKAEEQKAAYLKKTANNVDENTVKLLTDASAIDAGKAVFTQNCSACHGKAGEGTVGPNLTDDYWLHGGSLQDIFKTVKYGWPEKGMRSWKEDLSPVQIAQVSSYIKSLHGTNPPNGKEKQGELYQDKGTAAADSSSAAKPDSASVTSK